MDKTRTVIYADSLLIVNFSMDFLALFIAAKLIRTVIKPLKLSLGAAIGAAYSLASVFMEAYIPDELYIGVGIIGGALCALAMVCCAFGGSLKNAVSSALTYGAVNVGLGGLMTALYSFAGRVGSASGAVAANTSPGASPVTFAALAAISGGVSLMYGKITSKRISRRKVTAKITIFGRECEAVLLCDSGNLLRDPFGGKPVIILSAEIFEGIGFSEFSKASAISAYVEGLPECFRSRVRFIPADSVVGAGMLFGLIPDSVVVEGKTVDVVIAIDKVCGDYGGCQGIIPCELVTV